ncbi:hypothetical protein SAMN04488518_109222 [Pseudovibrio ascidiaceicola]|uniref:Uncharacterized protein n=1 Tax=Pseudovibrio ascidiaceicola TaxID=285279 RepID=A0A1I4CKB3_9HYPH|nr:hypothetical protein [Pseudovibrio ascidiaceicola]SFK81732.1 hypothetical protein SAMN04488518_109222 [Pseudovibrio ascidiaceicola]
MRKTIGAGELDAATLEFGLLVGLLLPEGKDPVEYKLNKDWLKDPVAQLRKQLKTVSKDLNGCLSNALNALKKGHSDSAEEFSKWNPLLFPAIGFGGHVGDLGEVPAIDWLSLITNGGDVPETVENWVQKVARDRKTLKAWGAALVGLVTGHLDPPTGTGTLDDPYLFAIMEVGSMGTLHLSLAAKEEKDGSVALVPGLSFDSDPIDLDGEN